MQPRGNIPKEQSGAAIAIIACIIGIFLTLAIIGEGARRLAPFTSIPTIPHEVPAR